MERVNINYKFYTKNNRKRCSLSYDSGLFTMEEEIIETDTCSNKYFSCVEQLYYYMIDNNYEEVSLDYLRLFIKESEKQKKEFEDKFYKEEKKEEKKHSKTFFKRILNILK